MKISGFMTLTLDPLSDILSPSTKGYMVTGRMITPIVRDFFQISLDPNVSSYYTAGDSPQFVIDALADRAIEIVVWDKALNKDHPLLQKAKAECEKLNPPLNKSVATKIWNKSTPEIFPAEWAARKIKYSKQAN